MCANRADRKLGDLFFPSRERASARLNRHFRLGFSHVLHHIQLHIPHTQLKYCAKRDHVIIQHQIDWGTHHVLVAGSLYGVLSQALRRPQNQQKNPPPRHSKLPFPQPLMIQLVKQICTFAQVLRIRRAIILRAPDSTLEGKAQQQSTLHRLDTTGQDLYAAAKALVEGFLPPKCGWLLEGWDILNAKTPAAGIPTNTVFTLAVQIWLSVECHNANAAWEILREPQFSTKLESIFQPALAVENLIGFPRVIFVSPVYLGPNYTHTSLLVAATCARFKNDPGLESIRNAYVTARKASLSKMRGAQNLKYLEAQNLQGSGGRGLNRYPPQGHPGQAYMIMRTKLQPYQACRKCSRLYRFAPIPGAIQAPCSSTFKVLDCAEDEWVLKAMARER